MYRDDSELIQACLNKDTAAWNELVLRYRRLAYSIPLRSGMSFTDADDVFQNVFVNVFNHLGSLRNHKLLAAWIIRITYHECQRLHKRFPAHDELSETFPSFDSPAQEEVELWEKRHLVHLALDQIGARCQELLQALFLESPAPSYKALAERLHIPEGSIGPTRARCFKKLEDVLVEMGFDAEG